MRLPPAPQSSRSTIWVLLFLMSTSTGVLAIEPLTLQIPGFSPAPDDDRAAVKRGAAESQPLPTPEEQLWERITALRRRAATPATQPAQNVMKAAERQRAILLQQLELYLRLFPGGRHYTEAVRLELNTRFELATLDGESLTPLCRKAAAYLADPTTSEEVRQEAAYWQIVCQGLQARRSAPASQPADEERESQPADEERESLQARYSDYVTSFPRSPYTPQLSALLFAEAERTGDAAAMKLLVERLQAHFATNPITRTLAGRLRRQEAVGRPFWLDCETTDGSRLDTRRWLGKPVAIVVWSSADAHRTALLEQITACQQAHPDLRLIGVNLDFELAEMEATCARLGVTWPQCNDGRGPANQFALEWGVDEPPVVFVLDRQGRLLGAAGTDAWAPLLAAELETR